MTPEELRRHQDEKAVQEANRDAYLLRKYGAEGLWKLQQQWLGALARLRPDLKDRFQSKATQAGKPDEDSH